MSSSVLLEPQLFLPPVYIGRCAFPIVVTPLSSTLTRVEVNAFLASLLVWLQLVQSPQDDSLLFSDSEAQVTDYAQQQYHQVHESLSSAPLDELAVTAQHALRQISLMQEKGALLITSLCVQLTSVIKFIEGLQAEHSKFRIKGL